MECYGSENHIVCDESVLYRLSLLCIIWECISASPTFWFGYTVIAISSAKSVKRSVFPQFDCQCGLNSSKLLKFFPWGIPLGWEVLGTPAVHHSKYWLVVVLAPESQQKGNPVMDK